MALALFGATALGLQHKEVITTLLGKPRDIVVTNLLFSSVQTFSAALFLVYYGELSLRSRNLLLKGHWRDLGRVLTSRFVQLARTTSLPFTRQLFLWIGLHCAGLWATKLGFIVLSAHVLAYRCQQECNTRLFHSFEQHFYRVQWYIRLFASAAATSSIAVAALLGTWSLLLSSDADSQDASQHPSTKLGAIPNSIAEAAGLKEEMLRLRRSTAFALVGCIQGLVCPLVLVYALWALWLPQLPLLQRFYFPFVATSNPGGEL